MVKIKYLFLLILFQFIISFQTNAQKSFDDESRADLILDISKYVDWPNEKTFKEFTIGVLALDTNLAHELTKLAAKVGKRKNKPIKIVHFKSIEELKQTQVLFVNKKDEFNLHPILTQTKGEKTLLISENYPYHRSMINFIIVDGKKRFEVNQEKLQEEGFQVSELFLALAIKTKADWEKLYEQTEYLLEKEKAVVKSQKALISKQKSEIEQQSERIRQQLEQIKHQQQEIDTQRVELSLLEKKIKNKQRTLQEKLVLLIKQQSAIKKKEKELQEKQEQIQERNITLEQQKKNIQIQEEKIKDQNETLNEQLKEIEKQRLILYFFFVVIVLVIIVAYFIYRNYKIKKRANIMLKEKNQAIILKNKEISKQRDEIKNQNLELKERNEEILQQKEEILTQRDEIEKQRDELVIKNEEILQQKEEILTQRDEITRQLDISEEQRNKIKSQNKQITDSIIYAKRIQSAILTLPDFFDRLIDQYFIFFKPKDIVSGDFYWASKKDDKIIIAAVDCTGHGVPGAFMSMLGVTFLTDIVDKQNITEPAKILNHLRENVIDSLKQKGRIGEVKEGMDMAICTLDYKKQVLEFAGASNSLILIQNNELREIKGDRMPVSIIDELKPFTNHQIDISSGDVFYMYSDGYADQFGGPKGRKFLSKRLKNMLDKIHQEPMQKQYKILESTYTNWLNEGNSEQIDDVLVVGIRY